MSKNTDWLDVISGIVALAVVGGVVYIAAKAFDDQSKKVTAQQNYIQYLEGRVSNLDTRVNQLQLDLYSQKSDFNNQVTAAQQEIEKLKRQLSVNPQSVEELEGLLTRLSEIKRKRKEMLTDG